ncbi:Cytosolic sulfotransferase 13 [Bienertia sinuspersici]
MRAFGAHFLNPRLHSKPHFQARDTDIILSSLPKTGTTWLKSLLFAIVNRKRFSDISHHPLQTQNSHELVLQLEAKVYKKINGSQPDFSELPSPRLFATHIPYLSLPKSVKDSQCRVIYVCRNPLDTFISSWHFYRQLKVNKGLKYFYSQLRENTGLKFFTVSSKYF